MRRELSIQERLEYDQRLELEYGRPLDSVPYQQIACFSDENDDIFLESLDKACELVEREKDEGRPRAFVTTEYDENYNNLYRVWSMLPENKKQK